EIVGVERENKGHVRLKIDDFVGGGFAGQVYRVRVLDLEDGPIGSLEVNRIYALKILIPPSGFSHFFRNLLYWIGFQSFFQPQVNLSATRAGALWQKFFRRGAKLYFGDENVVNDVHATFVDLNLGSCGEISDWVDGRTWKLEVDDHLDVLRRFYRKKPVNKRHLGSPEHRAKKKFMADFVHLLHEMGGQEFARQYEWWTCKSQPNCLKRIPQADSSTDDLVAVDFRAGLVLLPFLPMSPADVKLIIKGLLRGSLVQFDRGNRKKLTRFVQRNDQVFTDMKSMLEQLNRNEEIYRNSIPDISHHHVRLLFSRRLWSTILTSARNGWRIRGLIDQKFEKKLQRSKFKTVMFYVLGLIPLMGKVLRKIWGHAEWRKHYCQVITRWSYLKQAVRGKCLERLIHWHRNGRINEAKAIRISESLGKCYFHFALSILPAGLHRCLSDWRYLKERLHYIFIRPIKLYFNQKLREQWLGHMIIDGEKKQILNTEDARIIRYQLKESFIQKYLKSLAVHLCTLPVTQIVSIIVSWIYVSSHPEMSGPEAMAAVAAILVLFQITPISPGSLVRGFYVIFLVIKERNFRDYNIASFLSFFKYIGYLAFPIQMTYRYPELARFMAGHWATEVVHRIPVFGERGALLEHWVFNVFYNWPLTIRRRMRKIAENRASQKSRYWHIGFIVVVGVLFLGLCDYFYLISIGIMPVLKDIWWIVVVVPFICGVLLTKGCGGARLSNRIISALSCGVLLAVFYTIVSGFLGRNAGMVTGDLLTEGAWRLFLFAFLSVIGTLVTEIRQTDPDLKKNL
ncbi:MAG: hypothetical protein KAT17_09785, partial [Candidatus Aminicenantes bacterium]|nr:hypothetical protein [Candidatus Aminicenantes bacterium]